MADQQQQQGVDPAVADALKQHMQVASSMAKMGHDAMGAAHKQVMNTAGNHADLQAALANAAGGGQGQGGGGGAQQQAVWSAFPGTDPQVVQHISDPDKLHQLFAQDEQKLLGMHQQMQQAWVAHNSQPQGQAVPPDAPGVMGG